MTNNSQMPKHPPASLNDAASPIHIDVDYLSATGHVVIAGHTATLSVNTGGDVDQNTTLTLTVGGVETTRDQFEQLLASIRNLETAIDREIDNPDDHEVAKHSLKTMSEQLIREKKPNARILVQAANLLTKLSPAVAGAVVSVFSEPLVGQIISATGGIAQQFYNAMMNKADQ